MDAAEETDRRDAWVGIAHRHDMDGHAFSEAGHLAHGAGLEVSAADVDDPGQFVEMRQECHGPDYEGWRAEMERGAVIQTGHGTN